MKRTRWGTKGKPGLTKERTTARIADLMIDQVIVVTRHQSLGHARKLMTEHGIHSVPVVDADRKPIGIITSSDLLSDLAEESQVATAMTRRVFSVSPYEQPHVAARVMRKHSIHHLVVTDDGRVVGVISSFDLLRLVEDRRYTAKSLPKTARKANVG